MFLQCRNQPSDLFCMDYWPAPIFGCSCPEVFCEKGVLRNFAKLTGKNVCQSLVFNKLAGLRSATLLKKTLWHRCFPVNFVKFLRTTFFHRTPLVTASAFYVTSLLRYIRCFQGVSKETSCMKCFKWILGDSKFLFMDIRVSLSGTYIAVLMKAFFQFL